MTGTRGSERRGRKWNKRVCGRRHERYYPGSRQVRTSFEQPRRGVLQCRDDVIDVIVRVCCREEVCSPFPTVNAVELERLSTTKRSMAA